MNRLCSLFAMALCSVLFAGDVPVTVEGIPLIFGGNTYGQANVPAGVANVSMISVKNHAVALTTDGTVTAWGRNLEGQCNVPAGLSGVIAIATGAEHTLALKSDGTVVAWGGNISGECNVPADLRGVIAIDAGYSWHTGVFGGDIVENQGFSAALKSDGTVVVWGANPFGQ